MTKKKHPDNEITVAFKHLKIPLIDVENPKEAVKQIEQIMQGWDVIGKQKAETELNSEKIIVCKYVKDWVEPYATEGRKVPLVLFSTHPEWKAGTRFDNGLMECTFIPLEPPSNLYGYLVMVFDDAQNVLHYNQKAYRWDSYKKRKVVKEKDYR